MKRTPTAISFLNETAIKIQDKNNQWVGIYNAETGLNQEIVNIPATGMAAFPRTPWIMFQGYTGPQLLSLDLARGVPAAVFDLDDFSDAQLLFTDSEGKIYFTATRQQATWLCVVNSHSTLKPQCTPSHGPIGSTVVADGCSIYSAVADVIRHFA